MNQGRECAGIDRVETPLGRLAWRNWRNSCVLRSFSNQPIQLFAEWRRVVEWERLKARPGSRVHRVGGTGYSDREDVSAPINTFVTYT